MTEEQWLTGWSTVHMLSVLAGRTSDRKDRLFQCACCRGFWHLMTDERCRQAIEIAERAADGCDEAIEELPFAHIRAEIAMEEAIVRHDYIAQERNVPAEICELVAAATHEVIQIGVVCNAAFEAFPQTQQQISATLLRDIFGNPFRPVAFDPVWRTSDAVALARSMYDSRDFTAMPILADALQDAGCEHEQVLSHCRDANPVHVRGCWVCDLVLGKT